MATRPGPVPLTAAALGAVLLAALVALSPSQRAQSLGLTQHGALITAQDAGAADAVATVAVSPGTAGQVLTVSDAGLPHWAAVPSSGSSPTTYYISDGTAVAGSESASISGTGSTSSVTLGASSTARAYGTAGVTAARWILTLPSGARSLWIQIQHAAFTGAGTSGNRFVMVAVQNVSSGVPTALWGLSVSDATNNAYAGNLLGGANAGGTWGTTNALPGAADRWLRVSMTLDTPQLSALFGTGSAGAVPTSWTPPGAPQQLAGSTYAPIPEVSGQLYLVIVYQSFGGGSATAVTLRATVRVTT